MVTDRLLLEMVNRSVKPQRLWKEASYEEKKSACCDPEK